MGDDGLLLQLEFLEHVRLEDLLDLCGKSALAIRPMTAFVRRGSCARGPGLTESVIIISAESNGEDYRVDCPFLLQNEGADDEQTGRDEDIVPLQVEEVRVGSRGRHADQVFFSFGGRNPGLGNTRDVQEYFPLVSRFRLTAPRRSVARGAYGRALVG